MEKVALIFSLLTHDFDLMSWTWLLLSLIAGGWHLWYFRNKKALTEKELVHVSPEFQGINGAYIGFSVAALAVLIGFPMIVIAPALDRWALSHLGMKFYPSYATVGVGYAIYQAVFALYKGVYPMGRVLSYVYEDRNSISRTARQHILLALGTLAAAILFFFLTAG